MAGEENGLQFPMMMRCRNNAGFGLKAATIHASIHSITGDEDVLEDGCWDDPAGALSLLVALSWSLIASPAPPGRSIIHGPFKKGLDAGWVGFGDPLSVQGYPAGGRLADLQTCVQEDARQTETRQTDVS